MAADAEMDFSTMSAARALAVAKRAHREVETARVQHQVRRGQACARLHDLGWTWEQISAEMGVNLTTAYRWARPYLANGEE